MTTPTKPIAQAAYEAYCKAANETFEAEGCGVVCWIPWSESASIRYTWEAVVEEVLSRAAGLEP